MLKNVMDIKEAENTEMLNEIMNTPEEFKKKAIEHTKKYAQWYNDDYVYYR